MSGKVYLVGAGPGDPGLFTVKGVECLAGADVVIYDHLANSELLEHTAAGAQRIYVGKRAGEHTLKQEEINVLIADKAEAGLTVVRLKGGDPFVFGRGAEEALELQKRGIPFEVVPGVTAAIAGAAYAGIPVTHREANSVLSLVTGHEKEDKQESSVPWDALASGAGTIVFYMGVRNLPAIADRLIKGGRPADTPVAVVRWGTTARQETITGTLENIAEVAEDAGIQPPAVIIVGEVVNLREKLSWFENRPLFGKTVVVTRTRTQASRLAGMLRELGARVILFPTIEIRPADDDGPLKDAVGRLDEFNWIIFTSTNAVDSFFSALADTGLDSRDLAPCRMCCIGPGTAAALSDHGLTADLVPEKFTSSAVFDALSGAGEVDGKSLLLPRADIAPSELPDALSEAGATVTDVVAYKTVPGEPADEAFAALVDGGVDVVTFTSSSAVRNFASIMKEKTGALPDVICISIGPETSKAVREEGFELAAEAPEHTIDSLVSTILERFGTR